MKIKKIGNANIYHEYGAVSKITFYNDISQERVKISRSFAENGGVMFGIKCEVNGMGASNNKLSYWVCQQLFCADEFHQASLYHDVIGALGESITDFETWNLLWYWCNKIEAIPNVSWYKKPLFIVANRYGLHLLNSYGRSSWNKGGGFED